MGTVDRPGILLASASFGGTLAAVRNLGRHGIDVGVLASSNLDFCAAKWSRYATRSHAAPPERNSRAFVECLSALGEREAGRVLLPTSDETAWLYTEHAALLARHYRVYQPSITSLRRILDKQLFAKAALAAAVTVLPSWAPRDLGEVAALAPTLPYPVLMKPRTHVQRIRNNKGAVANSAAELLREYERFVLLERAVAGNNPLSPDAGSLLLQQFVDVADEGVCSVSGFLDRSGELFVTRRCRKILQRSLPVGVGVCFESLPADPALDAAVYRLCRELGYFGIFEVEFLRFNDDWAVIDFNPRFFNQMGMDIGRGMPLPLLAYLDACGETRALEAAIAAARIEAGVRPVFCDRFTLQAILAAKLLTGRIARDDLAHWQSWLKTNADGLIDVARDADDRMPGLVHALSEISLGLKAFPTFLRLTPRVITEISPQSVELR